MAIAFTKCDEKKLKDGKEGQRRREGRINEVRRGEGDDGEYR